MNDAVGAGLGPGQQVVDDGAATTPSANDYGHGLIEADDLRRDFDTFTVEGDTWTVDWRLLNQQASETIRWNGSRWGYNLWTEGLDDILFVEVATNCTP